MANVVRFRSRAQVYEEASLWLSRLDKGLSTEARQELVEWLQAEPMHRQVFFEVAAFWDELDVLGELSALLPLKQSSTPHPRTTRNRWLAAATAVGIVGVATLGGVVLTQFLMPAETALTTFSQPLTESFSTPIGNQSNERLPDGSVVRLNTDTELVVVYSTTERNVFLRRGEAHFDVMHDADHPFRVHVGNRVVEAVGTAFNVLLRPDGEIEVTVTDGKVNVTRAGMAPALPTPRGLEATAVEVFALVQGQVAILDEAASPAQVRPQIMQLESVDLDIKLAWQRGMLVFQGEPLQQMLAEVGRYTTAEFVLVDEALAGVRVGGYFRAGDIDNLLVALRENFKIDSETTADNRILLRAAD